MPELYREQLENGRELVIFAESEPMSTYVSKAMIESRFEISNIE